MKRRDFMAGSTMAVAAVASRSIYASDEYDLVLQNGKAYIDGAFLKRDIGVFDGKIAAIAEPGALIGSPEKTIDCSDMYISPGWVDYHVHCVDLPHGKFSGVPISRLGASYGVTAMLDAGTTGAANYDDFEKSIDDNHGGEECFALLNIHHKGIRMMDMLHARKGQDNIAALEELISQRGGRVKGLKERLDSTTTPRSDRLYYLRKIRKAADLLDLPIMIHIGWAPPVLSDILPYMKEGDTITHCLRRQDNSVVAPDGGLREDVREAHARGVRFDVAHGAASFSFDTAERALEQGFDDFIISSDIHRISARNGAKTFANVMSQFLALGMPLEDIVRKSSVQPARWLGIEREIATGKVATLTVFEIENGRFECRDTTKQTRMSDHRIKPRLTLINGNPRSTASPV